MDNALFIGDLHGDVKGLHHLLTTSMFVGSDTSFVFVLGDTSLFPNIDKAREVLSDKNFSRYKTNIQSYLTEGIPKFPVPVYLMTGNNDDPKYLQSWALKAKNLHYLPSTSVTPIGYKTDLINLNGIYADSAWRLSPDEAPYQYYTGAEIRQVKAAINNSRHRGREVILVTHPGAKDFILSKKAVGEGRPEIASLVNKPGVVLHLHGHHHVNYVNQLGGKTPKYSIGLGNFGKNKNSFFKVKFS